MDELQAYKIAAHWGLDPYELAVLLEQGYSPSDALMILFNK